MFHRCLLRKESIPFRIIDKGKNREIETLLDCTPEGGLLMSREKVAGMETFCFEKWAEEFVEFVNEQTTNGTKELLI